MQTKPLFAHSPRPDVIIDGAPATRPVPWRATLIAMGVTARLIRDTDGHPHPLFQGVGAVLVTIGFAWMVLRVAQEVRRRNAQASELARSVDGVPLGARPHPIPGTRPSDPHPNRMRPEASEPTISVEPDRPTLH